MLFIPLKQNAQFVTAAIDKLSCVCNSSDRLAARLSLVVHGPMPPLPVKLRRLCVLMIAADTHGEKVRERDAAISGINNRKGKQTSRGGAAEKAAGSSS